MSDIISEKSIEDYPLMVSIERMENILQQMKNNVYKVYTKRGYGTGFLCKILYNKQ